MIFHNIRPVEVNNGQYAAILNFINFKFFKMHPLLKPYNLFDINGVGESGACPPPGVFPPHHVYRTRVPPGEYYFSEDDATTIRHHFLRHDTHPGVSVFAEVNKTS